MGNSVLLYPYNADGIQEKLNYYRGSASHAANGARLYVDHTHPEYASPEALGPREAVLYDWAGDLLMHRAETALSRERGSRVQVDFIFAFSNFFGNQLHGG